MVLLRKSNPQNRDLKTAVVRGVMLEWKESMGKFDGPHFYCENENVVSVWVAILPLNEIPDDYFEEDYGGDDEDPFNEFSSDFGFGYYDHDFVEANTLESCSPINEILKECAYGNSFAEAAYQSSDIKNSEHVFLMYNFNYDPEITGITRSKYYKFIGVFSYNENA